ncbi:hypothetical protein DI272_24955 [Streptomyces sp. Act143]|uniref:hypothetical protein n=1 Tax=Streptomyces sp. Act143 TaxID=2200760 RepID=UPI000D67998A|nr:hypothetical protein DI272_24955 [Streptomyces sp. Act143]
MNHGLDDQSPEDGFDSDELALRRMLHQAVQEIEPRDGTLDHLRQAVPARRARKRQALVGMAAAALFIGTAVPALLHVSGATGSDADPLNAGHYSQAQGGASEGKGPDGGESTSGGSSGKAEDKGKDDKGSKDSDKGGGTGGATGPAATSTAGVPACTATDLGSATASSGAPDASGAVYGTFRYTNTSTAACTIAGPGSISLAVSGAADYAKVGQARHVVGDAAAALPDPSTELASLVLQPGSSYDVRFAWVPSETCPTTSGGGTGDPDPTPDPTPDPSPTEDAGTTTGTSTGGDTGVTTQLVREDGGTADGSVTITNSAEGGVASATTTVSNACAGTVYWTGVLTAS